MRPSPNLIKDVGRVVFWYPLRWIALALPFGAIGCLGLCLGYVDMLLSGRGRIARMERNIAAGLSCDRRRARRILLLNLQEHGRNMLEFMKYPQITPKNVFNRAVIEGCEHLDKELKAGRGVLLCTAHFGAKQMLQVALGHAGYPISQINYHLEAEALTWVQRNVAQRQRLRVEEKIPCQFISSKGFLGAAFRSLKAGGILIIAADGAGRKEDMDDSFVPLPFLGKTMRFPANYVSLAMRTGAALVPVFCLYEDGRHHIVLHPPLSPDEAVRQYVALLERQVRAYPHLWEFWEEFEVGELLVRNS